MYAEIEVKIERILTVRVPLDVLARQTGIPEERLWLDEHSQADDEEAVADWAMEQDDGYSRYVRHLSDWSEVTSYKMKEETK